jgi:uncharacterized OB-fold protein
MSPRPAGAPTADIANISADSWTEHFWRAARDHILVCALCGDCGTYRMPPTPFCPSCNSQNTEWPELSGRATVYSFTVVRHPVTPELNDSVPYVVAVIELDDAPGARLFTNIVECDPDTVVIGQAVQAVWDDVADGVTIPRFAPVSDPPR